MTLGMVMASRGNFQPRWRRKAVLQAQFHRSCQWVSWQARSSIIHHGPGAQDRPILSTNASICILSSMRVMCPGMDPLPFVMNDILTLLPSVIMHGNSHVVGGADLNVIELIGHAFRIVYAQADDIHWPLHLSLCTPKVPPVRLDCHAQPWLHLGMHISMHLNAR